MSDRPDKAEIKEKLRAFLKGGGGEEDVLSVLSHALLEAADRQKPGGDAS